MRASNTNESVTILLVEDDPGDQALTRRAFNAGPIPTDLHIAQDGEEALDYLTRRGAYSRPESSPRPDLILLDLNLPGLDGRSVLQRIRQDDRLKTIPVVALTTSQAEEDIQRTYELGVNSYIAKPVDMERFITTLRELGNYWFRVVLLPSAGV